MKIHKTSQELDMIDHTIELIDITLSQKFLTFLDISHITISVTLYLVIY